ncbi:MAG: hypothetical protein HZB56_21095 [Deltaproteobacteria bacterium]|nr:hypothetical protein [Deltaproteobacteria bacterium]
MHATLAALLASLALAAGATPADPAPPGEGEDPVQVPPGSAEDQALWRAGQAVAPDIGRARLRANKLQWEARQARTLERLEALARAEADPAAKKAADLLPRYRAALAFNHQTLTRQWPVDPTRGCGYSVMAFESVLYSSDHRRRTSQLTAAREDLQDCVTRAAPAVKVMAESNRDLEALTAEVQAVLPPMGVARPKPATPARN